MNAELLREAAALMRERAEAASGIEGRADVWFVDSERHPGIVGVDYGEHGKGDIAPPIEPETAEHIASWDPAVALAVADLIDAELTALGGTDSGLKRRHGANSPLLRLARAYLGREA